MVKLPSPKILEEKFYYLHGLYLDQDASGWNTIWRLYRASLFHLSLHASVSDFKAYAPWAKAKDVSGATFAVSLVEDLNLITAAKAKWIGVLADLAYANYVSALRLGDPDDIDGGPVRFATKLLLSSMGVFRSSGARLSIDEDKEVVAIAEQTRIKVEAAAKAEPPQRKTLLVEAAQSIYSAVANRGALSQIPYLPYTEAHGKCDLFQSNLVESRQSRGEGLLVSALTQLGLARDTGATDPIFLGEAREVLINAESTALKQTKIISGYEDLIAPTRLENVEFPPGDYANYMRVRSTLAGPIKNVRDQLMLVKNVLDDAAGHEAGQQLDTQAAMQVMASGTTRSDIFEQLEPMYKEEAWAILIDASKSISTIAHETKGIATCLAEVAKSLIRRHGQWAMYAFNNSLQLIKDFDEDYNMTSKARIGGLTQRNSTLLPDAIQIAYKRLATKEAGVRILVVVSDGYPSGYNDIGRKLISVVKEVSKSNVFLMGVGVDSNAIKDYFSVNCVLSSPYEMMKSFAKSYFELSYMF